MTTTAGYAAWRLTVNSTDTPRSIELHQRAVWRRTKHFAITAIDIGDWLFRYAMVIRVPLTFAGLMLLLSVLDRLPGPWRMLRGLFVLGRWETGLVTFVTITTAWVVVSTAETAWIAARPRQLVPRRSAWVAARKMPWLDRWVGHPPMRRFWFWRFVAVAVVAAPVIFAVRRTTELDFSVARYPRRSFNFAIAGGIAVFVTLYVVVAVAFGRLDRWLTAVTATPERRASLWLGFGRAVTRVIGGGYFRHDGVILPGPMFALVQFASFLAVYLVMGRLFQPDRLGADGCLTTNAYGWECLPPLASLMLVITVLCLLLTGLTFLLDRWRIPTLAVIVGLISIGQFYADVDHTFSLKARSTSKIEVTPASVVDAVMSSTSDRRLIVVAASGGGIATAAWTARVLTGLEAVLGEAFTTRLAAISGVSGGSVGTMFYLAAPLQSPDRPRALPAIVEASERSGLRNVAWGLAYPDLHRLLRSPIPRSERYFDAQIDRAWALEQAWRSTLESPVAPINGLLAETASATLSDWRERISAGEMPVPIFSAMTVEDGQQLLISPGAMRAVTPLTEHSYPGYSTLDDLYPGRDIDVVTAARLSASFPYVSPMARPASLSSTESILHMTDGGFFDNDGAVALQAWLESAFADDNPNAEEPMTSVLVIQIRWSKWEPANVRSERARHSIENTALLEASRQRKDVTFSLVGPVQALLAARSSTQNVRNQRAMQLLTERLERHNVQVKTVEFDLVDPPSEPLPLSWLLTPRDRLALACHWASSAIQSQVAAVGAFLGVRREIVVESALRTAKSAIPRPADLGACVQLYP